MSKMEPNNKCPIYPPAICDLEIIQSIGYF